MAGSWWKNALEGVKDAAGEVIEQAGQAAQGSDSALNRQAEGGVGYPAAVADAMYAQSLPERPAQVPAPAASVDEAAAALPPIETLATYQDGARRKGWDADNEIVLGEEQLDGFVLRYAHDNAAVSAVSAASFLTGGDMIDSYAERLTLYSAAGQELVTYTPEATSGVATLADGTVIMQMEKSKARKRYTATGVGPLEGLEWEGRARYLMMKNRKVSASQREREREADMETFHPWAGPDGGWVMNAKVRRSGAAPQVEVVIGNSLDARERLFAWAVALEYWYELER